MHNINRGNLCAVKCLHIHVKRKKVGGTGKGETKARKGEGRVKGKCIGGKC